MENLKISLDRIEAHLIDPKLPEHRRVQLQQTADRLRAQINDPNFVAWKNEHQAALLSRNPERIQKAEDALLAYEKHYNGV